MFNFSEFQAHSTPVQFSPFVLSLFSFIYIHSSHSLTEQISLITYSMGMKFIGMCFRISHNYNFGFGGWKLMKMWRGMARFRRKERIRKMFQNGNGWMQFDCETAKHSLDMVILSYLLKKSGKFIIKLFRFAIFILLLLLLPISRVLYHFNFFLFCQNGSSAYPLPPAYTKFL